MIIDGYVRLHDCAFQAGDPAREVDYLVKELDRSHADVAVLIDGCVEVGAEAGVSNAHTLAAVAAHPGRFVPFASIRAGAGERAIADELSRTVGAGTFRGISVDPALDHIPANSKTMYPVIEAAVQYDVPVWIATGVYPFATPTLVGNLASKFPRAKIICGHLGCELFYDAICAGRRVDSLYFDISFQGRAGFQAALRELGASRLIYGSGLPQAGTSVIKDVVERTRMPSAAKARILGGNMADLLGAAALQEHMQWAGRIPAFA